MHLSADRRRLTLPWRIYSSSRSRVRCSRARSARTRRRARFACGLRPSQTHALTRGSMDNKSTAAATRSAAGKGVVCEAEEHHTPHCGPNDGTNASALQHQVALPGGQGALETRKQQAEGGGSKPPMRTVEGPLGVEQLCAQEQACMPPIAAPRPSRSRLGARSRTLPVGG